MVECSGLLNRRGESYRGFESLSLREEQSDERERWDEKSTELSVTTRLFRWIREIPLPPPNFSTNSKSLEKPMTKLETPSPSEVKCNSSNRDDKTTRKRENLAPTKFFHVSTHRFKFGEFITDPLSATGVCLTDSPIPHSTIASKRILPTNEYRAARIEAGKWNYDWDGRWY